MYIEYILQDIEAKHGNDIIVRQNKIRHPNSLPLLVITEPAATNNQVENGFIESEKLQLPYIE